MPARQGHEKGLAHRRISCKRHYQLPQYFGGGIGLFKQSGGAGPGHTPARYTVDDCPPPPDTGSMVGTRNAAISASEDARRG
jgi:hypothetical protein